jgi:polysaccharide chain length determinant protein (PEP-CTERM system associated)
MLGHRELTIDDYLQILRRRLWVIVLPAILLAVVGYVASLRLPKRYNSEAVILLEPQKVPGDVALSPEELNQSLAKLREQILSRPLLQGVVERLGLVREWNKVAFEDLADHLKASIKIAPLKGEFSAKEGGWPGLSVSVTMENPRLAQQVCAEIASASIDWSLNAREQRDQHLTEFLATQLSDAKRKLDEQEIMLANFKGHFANQLPQNELGNLKDLGTFTSELDSTTRALGRARLEKADAEALLAQKLAAWQSLRATSSNPQALEPQLAALAAQLHSLQQRYTADHPDIMRTQHEIASLKQELAQASEASKSHPLTAPGEINTNSFTLAEPLEVQQLRNQIRVLDQTIREKNAEREQLQRYVSDYNQRLRLSPGVEREYDNLLRDRENALQAYNNLSAKKSQSEIATKLERGPERQGFRIVDAPSLPKEPIFPKRRLFVGGGFGLGLTLGFVLSFVMEWRDKAVRTESDVALLLGMPTLACIPVLQAASRSRVGAWLRTKGRKSEQTESPHTVSY